MLFIRGIFEELTPVINLSTDQNKSLFGPVKDARADESSNLVLASRIAE